MLQAMQMELPRPWPHQYTYFILKVLVFFCIIHTKILQKPNTMQYTHHRHEISAPLLTTRAFLSYITKVCTVTHVKTDRRLLSAAATGELSKRISQDVEEERATAAVSKAAPLRGVSVTLCLCSQAAFTSTGGKGQEGGVSTSCVTRGRIQVTTMSNALIIFVQDIIHFQVWTQSYRH